MSTSPGGRGDLLGLLLLIVMALVINFPNMLPWEKTAYPSTYLFDLIERLVQGFLIASIFLALFARPWAAWLCSWAVFLWWQPVSLVTRFINESSINSTLVGMAMASSPSELANLVLSLSSPLFVGFFLWQLGCWVVLRKLKKWCIVWSWSLRARVAVLGVALLLMPIVVSTARGTQAAPSLADKATSVDLFREGDRVIGRVVHLPTTYPYELPWAFMQYVQAKRVVNQAYLNMRQGGGRRVEINANSPDLLVLVIGESSSRGFWKLFNSAEVETTPRLSARAEAGEIYIFSNVVAQSNSTRQAVPAMLSSQPLVWPDGKANPNATESILSQLSRAGYKTAWFSNQAAIGRFDGLIAAYADEASVKAYLNPVSSFLPGSYDQILLAPLQRHIDRNDRSFIVLHTMGSHFDFAYRYPRGFGLYPVASDMGQEYRNSIAYTDAFLDQVIDVLERDGRSAAMLYISDHGQGLPGRCGKSEINRVTHEAYEVPALLWLSDEYKGRHPGVPALLAENSTLPHTVSDTYQTLVDLVQGVGGSAEESGAQSFLRRSQFSPKQMVSWAEGKWVDFESALRRNPCFIH